MSHFFLFASNRARAVCLGAALGTVLLGIPAQAQNTQPKQTQTLFKFRHQKPSQFIRTLTQTGATRRIAIPVPTYGDPTVVPIPDRLIVEPILQQPVTYLSGIALMTPDDTKKSLVVVGSKESLTQLGTLVKMLDVPAKKLTLRLRFWERSETTKGEGVLSATTTIEAEPMRSNTVTLLLDQEPVRLDLVPHLNGNGSLTLRVETTVDEQVAQGEQTALHQTRSVSTIFLPAKRSARALDRQLRVTIRKRNYSLEIDPTVRK